MRNSWPRIAASSGTGRGSKGSTFIQTGEHDYFIIGEWADMDSLAAARPHMGATLDSFRDTLKTWATGVA